MAQPPVAFQVREAGAGSGLGLDGGRGGEQGAAGEGAHARSLSIDRAQVRHDLNENQRRYLELMARLLSGLAIAALLLLAAPGRDERVEQYTDTNTGTNVVP